MKSTVKKFSESDLDSFVNGLINDSKYEVVGVKSKGKRFVFDVLENSNELRLDYDVTIIPPKKYFLPQYETLMQYNLKKSFEVEENKEIIPRIIVGVHPYDIIAIQQMDKVYLDDQKDDFYKKRRENTLIIGVNIQNVSERCFAGSLDTHVAKSGFDLMLTKIDSYYTAEIGSKKGEQLLNKYAKVAPANASDLQKIQQIHKNLKSKFKKQVKVPKEKWSSLLVANYKNSIWEEKSAKCMECSSCTMVCPTCYCYDVQDKVSLNLEDGERVRTWDGCLIRDFTKVTGGEVFRDDLQDRYRHRFFRKGNYIPERYDFIACVGCGRCAIACLPDIADPCNLINDLSAFGGKDKTDKFFIKQESKVDEKGIIHLPRSATIKRMEKLTENETLFELELDDKKPLNHKPGQFVEVSVFGIGEAPFGISSAPSKKPIFEIVVRRVGNVTSRLFKLKPGDKVGIRGPLGHGFDMKDFEKKHLIFASGGTGMIPMRSVINYVIDKENRGRYKDVTILYGCKQPCEVLFAEEIQENWSKAPDVKCYLTADRCADGECWVGEVGLITALFPKIKLDRYDSLNTVAIVIGPPVMYKFVIKCLETLGIPDENIWV